MATVVGFPLGYSCTPSKAEEAKRAIGDGADEIDMVMNIAAFKNQKWNVVKDDMQRITTIVHYHNKLIKVIIESGLLEDAEIIRACEICSEAEVNFVKTSSGFTEKGASTEAIKLIRKHLPKKIKIKAAGGIKSRAFAEELLEAGADRLGCSASVRIINE